jgi:hypothetical protein
METHHAQAVPVGVRHVLTLHIVINVIQIIILMVVINVYHVKVTV